MNRSRILPFLIVVAGLSLVLMGCGLVSPAVRLLNGPASSPTPGLAARLAERVVVLTPQSGSGTERIAVATVEVPLKEVQPVAPVTINIPSGADVESEILKAVYTKADLSVVYIVNLTAMQSSGSSGTNVPESQASGFVWDTDGHIITNDHVVEGADALEVTFSDGVELPADIVGTDPDSDLAVIKVDPKLAKLVPAEQGKIDDVQVGQRAIAIGNPFGLVGTMTSGIISAVGRSIPAVTGFAIPLAIQTDAAINPGNSGGPLLNDRGQVIGVNAQIRSDARANSGVGFAIPINIVQRVAPALIRDGVYRHAYLGLTGHTYSPAWAEALGYSRDQRGAYVMGVVDGGPAARSGLQAGTTDTKIALGLGPDGMEYLQSGGDLIIAIDSQPVTTFEDILVYLESFKSPGDVVKLTVLREGAQPRTVAVTLAQRPRRVP